MARTLKGTRARGLPPKVLLSQRQDATGSFPTVWRTSSDNRTGRYPVFFNDDKVIPFNQPVTDAGIFVTTYPDYEEKVVTVGSLGYPSSSYSIVFDNPFVGLPTVVITELTSNPNTPTVNAFIKHQTVTGSYVNFSAPFEGTFAYRAIYQPTAGTPVNVLRSPRYNDQYSLVVNQNVQFKNTNNAYVTFSDFGTIPTNNYVTFYDSTNSNLADISSSLSGSTNTSIQVTGSSTVNGIITLQYMGFGPTTASVDVKGIVYPLVMTPQAIDAGLSEEAKNDLYKQPYFSGSEIFNRPIVASGSMKKDVSDTFVTFTPGQDIEPFQDFANPAVDGKISASIGGVNPFYATGSLVTTTGLGFQQPVWSKNKIEIDITPAAEQTFTLYKSASAGSYPMGYWNPNTKLYEGIGTGKGIDSYSGDLNGLKKCLDEQTFGYSFSMDNGSIPTDMPPGGEQFNLYARQIGMYGFPFHPKFQPTSSQQILASNYVSEPFLLEKIVLELSGGLAISSNGSNTAIWSFFLLNSRQVISGSQSKTQDIKYTLAGVADYSTFSTSSILNGNIVDVVDTIQICISSSNDTLGFLRREQLIQNWPSRAVGATGSFQFVASSSVKSPFLYETGMPHRWSGSSDHNIQNVLAFSGRNQYYEANGRDWVNAFENPVIIKTGSVSLGSGPGPKIDINAKYTKPNPYILLPTDKLTFGFQLPYQDFNQLASNSFLFATKGINKIILYGSTLRLNPETNQLEEYHDTLNQLLSSNSIHEVISG